jgi:hypothetical protein
VSSLYAAILSATGTPLRLLERLVSSFIRLILGGSDEEPVATSTINAARALLSLVHQRHVDILRGAVGETIDDGEGEHEGDDQRTKKKGRKKKADELMISLSMVSFLSVCHYIHQLKHAFRVILGLKVLTSTRLLLLQQAPPRRHALEPLSGYTKFCKGG